MMGMADNGGFWPEGVLFIIGIIAILIVTYSLFVEPKKRARRTPTRRALGATHVVLALVLGLLLLVGINRSWDVDDPNDEQRERLFLTDD